MKSTAMKWPQYSPVSLILIENRTYLHSCIPGVLFTLFDSEVDPRLKADIRESIVSLLQILSSENLSHWLSMCKQVLLASKAEADKSAAKKENRGMLISFACTNPFLCVDDCIG